MFTLMQSVPQTIQTTYQQIKTQEKTSCLQLRKINNHYYVYKIHNQWNKQTKKPTKTTQLIGKITPNGTYHPRHKKTNISTTKTYEYGSSELLLQLSKDTQTATQNLPHKNELLALSIIRTIHPTPIRLAQTTWNDLHISRKINPNLNPKNITNTLTTIGTQIAETYNIFEQLTPETGLLFYDLTSILSYSKKLLLAERGYNPDWDNTNQIKIALAFSTNTWLPTAIDVFYGSMKETKILKYFVERFPNKYIGFIMDRGFTDYGMLLDFKKRGIHYIAALKKNSTFIPAEVNMVGAFVYRKRNVAFSKVVLGGYGFLYLFLDPKLRGVEEDFLLGRVAEGKLSMGEFESERVLAGVFGLVSDLDVEARVVYEQYKGREEIEQVFDFMKNDLDADRTYLGCDEAVRGYFVVVFLAMRLYFKILRRLGEHGLAGKVSVREVLFVLSKMRLVVEANGREYLCALPKKTEEILEVFSDLIQIT
jgi:transposase